MSDRTPEQHALERLGQVLARCESAAEWGHDHALVQNALARLAADTERLRAEVERLDKLTSEYSIRLYRAERDTERLRAALRPGKFACYACKGHGEINGTKHDDPRWVPCLTCEGTGLRQEVRAALASPPADTDLVACYRCGCRSPKSQMVWVERHGYRCGERHAKMCERAYLSRQAASPPADPCWCSEDGVSPLRGHADDHVLARPADTEQPT